MFHIEIGVNTTNSSCTEIDAQKYFDTLWLMGIFFYVKMHCDMFIAHKL